MKKITYFILATLSTCNLVFGDEDLWESKGPHIRIKKNDQDGSYVVFERSPDDRKLMKTMKNPNGKVKMSATYQRGPKGFLRNGQIHSGQGVLLFRVQYGYNEKTGQLIAEQMFDARVKRYYPTLKDKNGKPVEMPIRRVYYIYDEDGNQSRAISLVPKKGKDAEEVFKRTKDTLDLYGDEEGFSSEKSTRPDLNPFDEEKKRKSRK